MSNETIYKTRFPELGYVHDGPALWRIVDLGDTTWPATGGFYARVGPLYRSKAELLADLGRYAEVFGCNS